MITYPDLMVLKELNKGGKILYFNFYELEFVFRCISYKEYQDLNKCVFTDKDVEDGVCSLTLLYPKSYNFSECPYAGIVEMMAKDIIEVSCINSPAGVSRILEEQKYKMGSFYNQCVNLIKAVFHEYSVDEVLEWTWEEILSKAVRAEQILRIKGHEIELKCVDPEEIEAMEGQTDHIDKEMVDELRKNGIDPMVYYSHLFIDNRNDKPDFPLIGGIHWQREDVLSAIREQMEAKEANKKTEESRL